MYDVVSLVVFYFRGTKYTFHIIQYKCCAVFLHHFSSSSFLNLSEGLTEGCEVVELLLRSLYLNWHFKKRNGE